MQDVILISEMLMPKHTRSGTGACVDTGHLSADFSTIRDSYSLGRFSWVSFGCTVYMIVYSDLLLICQSVAVSAVFVLCKVFLSSTSSDGYLLPKETGIIKHPEIIVLNTVDPDSTVQ